MLGEAAHDATASAFGGFAELVHVAQAGVAGGLHPFFGFFVFGLTSRRKLSVVLFEATGNISVACDDFLAEPVRVFLAGV